MSGEILELWDPKIGNQGMGANDVDRSYIMDTNTWKVHFNVCEVMAEKFV